MPPMYPRILNLYRRGCLDPLNSACRRAAPHLPLTNRLALWPLPLAGVSFGMFYHA